MRKEKGQDIIEYALMLAMVVGIGFGIYSYPGFPKYVTCHLTTVDLICFQEQPAAV